MRNMTTFPTFPLKKAAAGLALLTNQEARLLTLALGLLLLGLATRYVHLRSETSRVIKADHARTERTHSR